MDASSKVTIIGLGYVGLPLAVLFAERGHAVLGLDKDTRKIESIIKGESYIPDVSSNVLQNLLNERKLIVNTPDKGVTEFQNSEYVIVTVPTPINENKEPDLSALVSASYYIQQHLQKGQTFIFESSTYPGTLEEVIIPIISQTGKKVGEDYYIGYSPERIDPANSQYSVKQFQKLLVDKPSSVNKKYKIYIALYLM